jgi:hypothetical protein
MKNISLIIFLWVLIFCSVFGQESVNAVYENFDKQVYENVEYKKNRFTVLLDFPSLAFASRKFGVTTNVLQGMSTGFDYNFSEILSLGLREAFYISHIKYFEANEEEKLQALYLTPVFKVNLGKNQMFVPFLEASYTFSAGKYYCTYADNYTKNYIRHILSGGVGIKMYASRWFKKTKYKNNFGIELCFSKALFLFDNSINVPVLMDRSNGRLSFFYKF